MSTAQGARRRIVITGMGAVSAAGVGAAPLWAAARDGVSCIRPLRTERPYGGRIKIAAQVPDFDPKAYIAAELLPYCDPFTQFSIVAADEAVAQAGFTEQPQTWAELKDQAAGIKAQGIDEYPIAMGAIDWSWYLIALSMGDPMFDADMNPVFANEGSKAREAMALLLSFFSEGLITPDILSGATSQHSAFWGGTGTFHQGWQGSVVVGNGADSKQAPDVKYLLLPESHFTWSFPAAIGIAAGSPNADAAMQFIEWYTGTDNQLAIYNAFGLYPSRTSVAEQLAAEDKIAGNDVIVEQAGYVNELPRQALWWGPFTTAVSTAILEAAQAGTPADQVIDDLATQWNDLKAEYE